MSPLVSPHGGPLVDRFAGAPGQPALRSRLFTLPRVRMDAREAADLELIATGGRPGTGRGGSHGAPAPGPGATVPSP